MNSHRIFDGIATLVCDLDGVVYIGEEGIAGSGAALDAVDAAGIRILFVTNNSTKTAADAAAKIERTSGHRASAESVVTSAQVTAARLAGSAGPVFVVGARSINMALEECAVAVTDDWSAAEAVVVGLDRDISYEKLSHATLAIRNGATFYATNADATFPTPQGLLPGGGAIVGALQIATGVDPIVSGKPQAAMCEHIAALADGPILVVGDRVNTDIAMARRGGWSSALVLTGVTKSLGDIPASEAPDLVVASLGELAAGLLN